MEISILRYTYNEESKQVYKETLEPFVTYEEAVARKAELEESSIIKHISNFTIHTTKLRGFEDEL